MRYGINYYLYFCYMKYRVIYTAFVIGVVLLPSCRRIHSPNMMDSLDSMTYSSPLLALEKLDSMQNSLHVMNQSERMRYQLLRVKAKFKSYQPIDKDSEIVETAEYFSRNGTDNLRMNAYYLLGNYYAQRSDAPKALTSLNKALEYADTVRDTRALMLIHGMIQDLYENVYLYDEARKEMELAVYYAIKCDDTISALIYKENLPWLYSMTNQYDHAETAAAQLYREWKKTSNGKDNSLVLSYRINALLKKKEWSKAKAYLDIYERNFHSSNVNTLGLTHILYNYKSQYYIGVGKTDSALYWLRRQQRANGGFGNRAWTSRNYMNLYKQLGCTDSVLKYAELYCSYSDSTLSGLNVDRVVQIKGMYNYNRQQEEIYRQHIEKYRLQCWMVIGFSVCLAFLLWLIYIVKRNKRCNIEEMQQQNEKYENLINQYRLIKEQYELLKENDIKISKDKVNELELQLSNMLLGRKAPADGVVNHPWVVKMRRKARIAKSPTRADWDEVESVLEQLDSCFLEWLNRKEPYINVKEYRLCVLIRLGFIPTEMAILLSTSRSNITNIRSRLTEKLFGKKGSSSDFDILISQL